MTWKWSVIWNTQTYFPMITKLVFIKNSVKNLLSSQTAFCSYNFRFIASRMDFNIFFCMYGQPKWYFCYLSLYYSTERKSIKIFRYQIEAKDYFINGIEFSNAYTKRKIDDFAYIIVLKKKIKNKFWWDIR